MRKVLGVFAVLLAILCLVPAYAAPLVVEVDTLEKLNLFLNAGVEMKLTNDITVTNNTFVNAPGTLDLNGHTLNMQNYTLIPYEDFVIKDTSAGQAGKITSTGSFVIQCGTSSSPSNLTIESGSVIGSNYAIRVFGGRSLTVNGGLVQGNSFVVYNQGGSVYVNDGTVRATGDGVAISCRANGYFEMNGGLVETLGNYVAVVLSNPGAKAVINDGTILAEAPKGNCIGAYKDTEITINDGVLRAYGNAVYGNGSNSGSSEGTNAKITVNGGRILSSHGDGIYAPQINGLTTINGGTISGSYSGIEIRAGRLVVNGGTISSTAEDYVETYNDNGATMMGAGIAISQHVTKQPIDVVVTNGNITGPIPFSEANLMGADSDTVASQMSYDISGGIFTATQKVSLNGSEPDYISIKVDNWSDPFVSGGKYVAMVEDTVPYVRRVTPFVKDGYGEKCEYVNSYSNMDAVYPWRTVTLQQTGNGNAIVVRQETKTDDGTNITAEDFESSPTSVRALYGDVIYVLTETGDGYYTFDVIAYDDEGDLDNSLDNYGYLSPNKDSVVIPKYLPVGQESDFADKLVFYKFLIMSYGDNVPNASFSFNIAPGQAHPFDVSADEMEVYAGIGSPVIGTAVFAPGDAVATDAGSNIDVGRSASDRAPDLTSETGVQLDAGEKFARSAVTIDFSRIYFENPGIYRYVVTEVIDSDKQSSGYVYDNDLDRIVDVFVFSDENGHCYVNSIVMYTNDAPVSLGPDMGSSYGNAVYVYDGQEYSTYDEALAEVQRVEGDPNDISREVRNAVIPDKTDGFTNEYHTKDLVVKKEVVGNFASRDKYFAFRVHVMDISADDVFEVSINEDDSEYTTDGNADSVTIATSSTKAENRNKTNVQSVTGSDLGSGVTFYLRHGQQIAIRGLPITANYTVTEDPEDYRSTVLSGCTNSGLIETVAGSGRVAVAGFLNEARGIVPTGVLVGFKNSVLFIGAGLLAIALLFVTGRHRKVKE